MRTTRLRAGLSVRVSAENAVAIATTPSGQATPHLPVAGPVGDIAPVDGASGLSGASRRLARAILRPPARLAFRVIRPFARPVLFRIRRYFMEPLHRQVSSEAERLNARVSGESERLNGTVVEEVRASTASMTRRIKELADSIALLSDQISRDDTLLRTAVEYAGAAASRIAIADGGGLTMVRTMVGYVVVASNDHALIASLVESGELEPGTRQVIERTLRPGDVFVDVGANIGLHTIAAGRKVGPEGRVLAFEPFAPTVALLERSIWMNDLTEVTRVFPVGLSSQAGKHDLFLGGTSGHHSLFPLDGFEGASRDKVTITTTTLDEAVGPGARVDLIKIDAEGAELDVLEGARHVLKDNPDAALIVELGTSHLNRAGTILEEWLGAFSALGLRPFVIDEVSGILSATDVAALAGVHSVNLFFAPHTGTALERARA